MDFRFKSKRLSFAPLAAEDEELYIQLYTSSKVMKYIAGPLNLAQAKCIFQKQLKPWSIHSNFLLNLRVSELESGCSIGVCGIITRNLLSKQAEVGMVLLPKFHSNGYGTEILCRLSQFGFEKLGYNKLWGPPFPENKASIQIMEKSGYTQEATLRQNHYLNGEYHDTPFYTLLKENYDVKNSI